LHNCPLAKKFGWLCKLVLALFAKRRTGSVSLALLILFGRIAKILVQESAYRRFGNGWNESARRFLLVRAKKLR